MTDTPVPESTPHSLQNPPANGGDLATSRHKRNRILLGLFLGLLVLAGLTYLYWLHYIRFHEQTDDAYVNGNLVILMAPQTGITVAIYADDTNFVQQGQLLVELDTTNYQLAFDRSLVDLALATRQVKQLGEEVQQRKADVRLRDAEFQRTKIDYENRLSLQNTQAISKEDFSHAKADFEVAQAALNVAQHQLESSAASLGNTPLEEHPMIQNAKIAVNNAYVNLMRCEILSPVNGFVAQRNVQVGEWVTPTRALMNIIPLDQIWVDANFKETQLSDIRIGQSATVESDIYGSKIIYHGKVQGLVAGTGSVFSLIPPQNATGNWIKIVQRVPVRIALEAEQIKQHPLLLGLSAYVNVHTEDQEGLQLANKVNYAPQFSTSVFDVNLQALEPAIQDIIQENLKPPVDQ